jgi:glycosyltransferase involved in cell wall biosynthesis
VRIAIFDYRVVLSNPTGGCHRRLLEGLCREHEFTVFAVEFDNPCPDRISWVHVPVPTRPLALLFVAYHVVAPAAYLLHRIRHRIRYDLVQRVEDNLSFGQVGYVHFCHRTFLSSYWSAMGARGLRARLRWLDHWLHALLEPVVYRRTRQLVVPSLGLERELEEEYPFTARRIVRIPNPVDVDQFSPRADFDRESIRRRYGLSTGDVLFAFTALGQFERKGLPLVLRALRELPHEVKILIVGGNPDLVKAYARRASGFGVRERTIFIGMTEDVRPFLWAADAFVFPSFYEVFSLSAHEAAAAGLPVIATPVHGLVELFHDGESALFIDPTPEGVASGIKRLFSMSQKQRAEMGAQARAAVEQFVPASFVDRWRKFYETYAEGR